MVIWTAGYEHEYMITGCVLYLLFSMYALEFQQFGIISPDRTQQFILLYSGTCFGLKSINSWNKNRRMYTYSLYGTEISKPHILCYYVGIYNMGRTAVGNIMCINIFIIKKDWIRITYFSILVFNLMWPLQQNR